MTRVWVPRTARTARRARSTRPPSLEVTLADLNEIDARARRRRDSIDQRLSGSLPIRDHAHDGMHVTSP